MPWWLFTLITLATVCIAAGGYVINDYFDVKIDRINRPDQLIVTRTIDKERAMNLFIGLTAVGIALGIAAAVVVRSMQLGIIFILIPGLLWFYSSAYKRQFMVGNLIIALCAALVPLLISIAYSGYLTAANTTLNSILMVWIGAFAIFAFLTTWVREIVKDLQDQMGDRELECHTLAVVWGEKKTKIFATVIIAITAALAIYIGLRVPFDHSWQNLSSRYIVFGMLVPMACELVLLWRARISSEYKNAQTLMKFIMLLGVLYSFVILKQL